jgi:two-component system CheB/CheR fusion protein
MHDGRDGGVSRNRNYRKDGRVIHCEWYNSVVRDDAGRIASILSFVLDVTERTVAEAEVRRLNDELRASLAAQQAIFDIAPVGVCVARDPRCTSLLLNRSFAELLGVGEQLAGPPPGSPVPDPYRVLRDGRPLGMEALPLQRAAREGRAVEGELLEVCRGAHWRRRLLCSAVPLRDESGAVTGAVGTFMDVTRLEQAEQRFRVAQDISLFGFTILRAVRDAEGRVADFAVAYANPVAATLLGRRPEELVGQRLLHLLPGNARHLGLFPRYVDVVESGVPHDEELRYDADGVHGWFRTMVVRLEDGVAVSFSDVTERRRLEEELARRLRELAEADRRKDEFLAMLAHELRNPLGPIRNAVHLLRRRSPDDPPSVQAREMIDRQVSHMTRLIDDLLDVSRITRGLITLRTERVSLQDVLEAAVETARPALDVAGHELVVQRPGHAVHVEGDLARLVQVFANLLTNAAKFTAPGGRVTVRVEPREGAVVVRVRDTGVGIEPAMQARILDLFVQEEASLDRSRGGLGIGLTLVRRLVELHGGQVEVASAGRGRGSEFVVTLPALPPQIAFESREGAATHPGGTDVLSILIVEDNRDAAESLRLLLELSGHDVRVAHDGVAALGLMDQGFVPDVGLLDLGLPGMDGFELARALREHRCCRATMLVAVSGYGRDDDKRRAQEAGFDQHLTKPVDPTMLETLLAGRDRRHPGDPPAARATEAS